MKVLQYVSSTIFFITRYIASTCDLQPGEVQLWNLDNLNTDDLNSLVTQTNFFSLIKITLEFIPIIRIPRQLELFFISLQSLSYPGSTVALSKTNFHGTPMIAVQPNIFLR